MSKIFKSEATVLMVKNYCISNYRLISLITAFSKVVQKVMYRTAHDIFKLVQHPCK
jgi:hypothetical protein